jgi:hypothetical protein
MKRLRWLLVLLVTLLLAMGGATAWANVHRGYPYAVYHSRFTLSVAGQVVQSGEEWTDAERSTLRIRQGAGRWYLDGLVAGGLFYLNASGGLVRVQGQPVSLAAQPVSLTAQFRAMASGGYRALGLFLLGHAAGSVAHTSLDGQPVVHFSTTMAPIDPFSFPRVSIWLDARSLLPLQWQFDAGNGALATIRYHGLQRLAPDTLPAVFFGPPHTQQSLWQRVTGWLQDHLPCRG